MFWETEQGLRFSPFDDFAEVTPSGVVCTGCEAAGLVLGTLSHVRQRVTDWLAAT